MLFRSLTPLGTAEFRREFTSPEPRFSTLAAVQGDRVVGFGCVAAFNSRGAYADTASIILYLRAGLTGRGVGTALCQELERRARQAGMHALLASICAENEPSLKLFRKLGYREVGRFAEVGRKFGRWLDVVYVEKLLQPEG